MRRWKPMYHRPKWLERFWGIVFLIVGVLGLCLLAKWAIEFLSQYLTALAVRAATGHSGFCQVFPTPSRLVEGNLQAPAHPHLGRGPF
jgi:hypothetical protein